MNTIMNSISYLPGNVTSITQSGEVQRLAYNTAFRELGLRWHWDRADYDCQMCVESQRAHLRRYVENQHPHMLKVYEAEFLVNAIQTTMVNCLETAGEADGSGPATTKWAVIQHGDVGF